MHEAGHAYAYAALIRCEEPRQMGLGIDDDGAIHGWCSRNTILYRSVRLANVAIDALPAVRWQAAAEIVIAIAGTLAEFRHRHRSRGGAAVRVYFNADRFLQPNAFDVDGDFQKIRDVLDYIQPTDQLESFQHLIGVSAEIVDANWPAVTRLGRGLIERGVIDEDELFEWFQIHPAKRHDDHLAPDHHRAAVPLVHLDGLTEPATHLRGNPRCVVSP